MATEAQIANFINMMIPIARRQAKKHDYKLYASVCIAQAAHESAWGTSAKMAKAKALFGVKVGKSQVHFGSAWKGASYNTKTKEYYNGSNTPTTITDNFRAYASVEDSTEDYMDLLCSSSRYRGALNQPSPQKCIEGIKNGGYATGPDYVKHIMQTINKRDLTRYDGPTEYYPKYKGATDSIVIALDALGIDSSFEHRIKVFNANFYGTYKGSEKQNLDMVQRLKDGELIKA